MMPHDPASHRDELVLVLAPTGRDGQLACDILTTRAAVTVRECADDADLCAQILAGCGTAILAEEALDVVSVRRLLDTLASQLPWSDLPLIVLASPEIVTAPNLRNRSPLSDLRQKANLTVLDRPLRIVTLVTAVHSALRARRRQYQVRDLLAETRHAVKQRDQFLAMLGHELRNPLGAIANSLTVIDAASPCDDPIENEQRDIIRRQTDHLARLVDDLLDVSRITTGKIVLQRRQIDLCDVARRAAQAVDGPARAQRHSVIVDVACDPVHVDADPVRIEQVVNNLLTNAIKYTPSGGKIELTVRPSDDHTSAILRVRDNGMGMPRELIPRVFELFTQADRALDRAQGGLGIGLTLVRSLIEMHDGTVDAHSDGPGTGSQFVITLPLLRVAPAATPPSSPHPSNAVQAATEVADRPPRPVPEQSAPSHNGKHGKHSKPAVDSRRILIIEDQPDARRALQRLLQIWGHEVDVAEDGPAGVSAAAKFNPELAFVDVGLPGLDGYEVARRIRAQLGNSVRLVALTGYGQPEDRARALDAGFDLHLVKPVERDQLARTVADAPGKTRV
jgi:signal transduction histidine kinase/ActR/RegA family two-component response regulator